ncbi:MAG: hypothetical protein IPO88_17270 [Nannocystis sp.]|uniref:hypothetical protein n=1 Tax=Nannocystis sp. TaxID=1962667 RepID=UPI0024256FF8|nr:hypothetical protein [Nannocystis sp.]MBK9755215.1 hypothetical protein [Nannocystis sp.]
MIAARGAVNHLPEGTGLAVMIAARGAVNHLSEGTGRAVTIATRGGGDMPEGTAS